jgi:type III restriction enzyme
VQIDSGVEEHFVQSRLVPDDKVVGFFKFPPAFRIDFPRLVGDYNPDWGILRQRDDGKLVLQLVRETKGSEELGELQFPHERRKIEVARKHFGRVGIDYRVITDQTPQWWLSSDELPVQERL